MPMPALVGCFRPPTVGLSTDLCTTVAAIVGGGGYAHAAEFVGVILAIEDVPLFAAFEDFFFLRSDALADFGVGFLFFFQRRSKNLHDLLADGVAILDKFNIVAGDQDIGDLMRQPNHFFARKSHARIPAFPGCGTHDESIGKEAMDKATIGRRIFRDALNAAPACGRAPTALSPFCTSPGRKRRCGAFHPDAVSKSRALHRSSGPRRSALPSCAGARVASPLRALCSQSGCLQ